VLILYTAHLLQRHLGCICEGVRPFIVDPNGTSIRVCEHDSVELSTIEIVFVIPVQLNEVIMNSRFGNVTAKQLSLVFHRTPCRASGKRHGGGLIPRGAGIQVVIFVARKGHRGGGGAGTEERQSERRRPSSGRHTG
jgi:hypothetical protein